MKISLVNVLMIGSGIILIYSGLKAYYPQDVIRWGLGGERPDAFNDVPRDSFGFPEDDGRDTLAPGAPEVPFQPEYNGGGSGDYEDGDLI